MSNTLLIGDRLVDKSDIVSISEKTINAKIEVPRKSEGFWKDLLASPEYRTETYTCVVITVQVKNPREELLADGYRIQYSWSCCVYHDRALLDYAWKCLENLSRISPTQRYGPREEEQAQVLKDLGMAMEFGRRWTEPNYLNTNMHYDSEVRTKQDFFNKYMR